MKIIKSKPLYILAAIFAVVVFIIICFSGGGAGLAYAANNASDVLSDLSTDSSFNAAAYPKKGGDYSLHVIQIAESTDGELLVYVYQPATERPADMRTSSINISRYPDNTTATSFVNYKLEYLNSSGTLYKYKVIGFDILKNDLRYYNVSNIMRTFSAIDIPPKDGNTISEVPYAVGQCWTATTVNGKVTYSMTVSEVIEIKDKYVGYINYFDGVTLGWTKTTQATSAHFVAFSTSYDMDKLISARLTFCERAIEYKICNNWIHIVGHKYKDKFDYVYGEITEHAPITLYYKEKATNAGGGNIKKGTVYKWDRIQSTKTFLSYIDENTDYKITQTGLNGLEKTQWVLNFYETPYLIQDNGYWISIFGGIWATLAGDVNAKVTEVSDVMILQLEFEKDGKVYNLGVVDNKQTGASNPVGGWEYDNSNFWEKCWAGITNSWKWLTNSFQKGWEWIKNSGQNWQKIWEWLTKYWWTIPVGILGGVLVGVLLYFLVPLIGRFFKWLIGRLFGGKDGKEEEPKPKEKKKGQSGKDGR